MNIYQDIFFKALDLMRGRKNLEKLKFLRKSQYWTAEKLKKWQLEKLNMVLKVAKERAPFYRLRLKNIVLPLKDISELENIPILTKKDMRENFENIKCKQTPDALFILGKTGGSTGEPTHYYYDKRGRDWNRGTVYRSQEWAGTTLGERLIQMTGSHYDLKEFDKLKWKIVFWLQRYKCLPVSVVNDEIFEHYYQEVMRYKPTSVWGYASGIYYFSQFIEKYHKSAEFPYLKAVITSSETLHDYQREKINAVFGKGKVYDHYGSREVYIASECNGHNGYHIHGEVILVEVVGTDNKQKKAGKMGRIVITDLSNLVFPFVRYEIGDVGIMAEPEDCPCGVKLPKLKKVLGRIDDVVTLADRVLTSPNFTIVMSDFYGVAQYQVVQESKELLKLFIVKNDSFKSEYEGYIRKSFSDLTGPNVNVEINYVDNIEVPLSGKRRTVISKVKEEL